MIYSKLITENKLKVEKVFNDVIKKINERELSGMTNLYAGLAFLYNPDQYSDAVIHLLTEYFSKFEALNSDTEVKTPKYPGFEHKDL